MQIIDLKLSLWILEFPLKTIINNYFLFDFVNVELQFEIKIINCTCLHTIHKTS